MLALQLSDKSREEYGITHPDAIADFPKDVSLGRSSLVQTAASNEDNCVR